MYERSTSMPGSRWRPESRRHLGRFPKEPTAVGEARRWLFRRLELSTVPDSPRQDALLLLSELATNALLPSPAQEHGGAFLVSVFVSAHSLRVCVRDCGDTHAPPLQAVPAAPEAEHGRGLFLVDALAATWGIEHDRQAPAVFFTLEWGPSRLVSAVPPTRWTHRPSSAHKPHGSLAVPTPRTPFRHQGGW